MKNIYNCAKNIHRILTIPMIVFGAIMAVTGTFLKWPELAPEFAEMTAVRSFHSQVSVIFTITLVVSALAGAAMYIYPVIIRFRYKNRQDS